MADKESLGDARERNARFEAEALAAFPFERIQVNGDLALQEWERLKTAERGAPVVIGGDQALRELSQPFHPQWWGGDAEPSPTETLAKADRLTHPEDLLSYQKEEEERLKQRFADDPEFRTKIDAFRGLLKGLGFRVGRNAGPAVGWWPLRPPVPTALTVGYDWETDRPFDTVYIVLVPTDDWTTIPAYLRWGNWNQNPPSEYHVAALRSWRDRYHAELVGLSFDVMNIRVARKPKTRDEAMALAREQYTYCSDIVDQGVGTLSKLAATLKAHDWWFFWWD